MKKYLLFENRETLDKWIKNVLIFTAPSLALFFTQLSQGVNWKLAGGVALLAFWGLLADYLKKVKSE